MSTVEAQKLTVVGGTRAPAAAARTVTASSVTAAWVASVAKTPSRALVRRSRNVAVTRLASAAAGSR